MVLVPFPADEVPQGAPENSLSFAQSQISDFVPTRYRHGFELLRLSGAKFPFFRKLPSLLEFKDTSSSNDKGLISQSDARLSRRLVL